MKGVEIMPHGDRTGPMGQGSKTGRAMGYCSGSDSPGYTAGGQAGTGRMFSRGAGGRSMGRGTGRGFRCRNNSGLERGRGFFSRNEHPGYYYPETSQSSTESNIEFFENRIRALKQEFEAFIESLKTQQPPKIDEKK